MERYWRSMGGARPSWLPNSANSGTALNPTTPNSSGLSHWYDGSVAAENQGGVLFVDTQLVSEKEKTSVNPSG